MDAIDLAVLSAVAALYALLSGRLRRTVVTSAIFFLTAGVLLGDAVLGWFVIEANSATLRLIAEATLALVLFTDASRIKLGLLLHELAVPARLLGVGLPLTLIIGAVAAFLLLPGLTVVEAALLAIAVAPTDAALGQAVVADERVPSRIRQGLNVESGLNDGLCVPLLIIALAVASAEGGAETEPVRLILEEIGFGVVGGLLAGALGALGLRASRGRGWLDGAWGPLVPIAVTGLAYGIATILHGSGLIAAFSAGLTFGSLPSEEATESVDVVETIGDGFSAVTFMLFGASIVPMMLDGLTWPSLAFVVVALTLARMLPVAIALIGLHARPPTIGYLGWFGPRGLASIVFGVLIFQADPTPNLGVILATISLIIVVSVYAHGLTAQPLTDRYVTWLRSHPRPEPLERHTGA